MKTILVGRRRLLAAAVVSVVAVAGALTLLHVVTESISSNPAMERAIRLARTDPDVNAALGSPVASAPRPRGHLQCSVLRTTCSLDATAEVSGPLRSATLNVKATGDGGRWTLTTAIVIIDGAPPVDLLRGGARESPRP